MFVASVPLSTVDAFHPDDLIQIDGEALVVTKSVNPLLHFAMELMCLLARIA